LQRRLAAILAVDVVNYTRLMSEDQARTLDALRQLRTELLEPVVSEHNGTVVKRMGDGWIVDFASVSDAVDCALHIHEGLAGHEVIRLRSGIHIGDVVFEEEDVFGDGVNVAARLEELAEPGEVLISDTVYRSLDGKAAARFRDGKSHQLKNVARSVQVWRWPAVSASAVAPIVVAAMAEDREHLALPDKPSIAVLAFDNLSGDPEQEYFSDGITGEIINSLSKNRGFFVIARNSTFTYKGQAIDLTRISRELGVRYVLEGSVRKAGSRVRIAAQLVDALHGNQIWADKFDGDLTDLFAVQDEIAHNIVATVAPEMLDAEMQRVRRIDVQTLEAWEFAIRAQWHLPRLTKEDNADALRFALKAMELDPGAPLGFSIAAFAHIIASQAGWSESAPQAILVANELATRAVELDSRDAVSLTALGTSEVYLGRHDDGIAHHRMAIECNSNLPWAHGNHAVALIYSGRGEDSIASLKEALRLSPRDPFNFMWHYNLGLAAFFAGRYQEGLDWTDISIQESASQTSAYRIRAGCLSQLDRIEEAREAMANFLRFAPDATVESIRAQIPLKRPEDIEHHIESLRRVGLPEQAPRM